MNIPPEPIIFILKKNLSTYWAYQQYDNHANLWSTFNFQTTSSVFRCASTVSYRKAVLLNGSVAPKSIIFELEIWDKQKKMWSPNRAARTALVACILVSTAICQETTPTEEELRTLLDAYNTEAVELCNAEAMASWNVATNVGKNDFLQAQVWSEYFYYNIYFLR